MTKMSSTRNMLPFAPEIVCGATYISVLKKRSEENPDKKAFIFIDKDWNKRVFTRKDVWDNSRKFAAILRRQGIKKGDIVCNTLVNSPERVITSLGTVVAGAISMNGQMVMGDGADLLYNMKISKCQVIIADPGQTKGAFDVLQRIQSIDETSDNVRFTDLPDLTSVMSVRVCNQTGNPETHDDERGLRWIETEREMFAELDTSETDGAFIFNTSGTTGFCKQVVYSHRSTLRTATIFSRGMGAITEDSIFYSDRSLGWVGGMVGPYLVGGGTRVMSDNAKGVPPASPERILRILNEFQIDSGILLPGQFDQLVKYMASGHELKKRLSTLATGGMPVTKRILEAIGVITDSINVLYGATEGGYLTVLHLEHGTPFEDYCVGFPVDEAELKIVDANQQELPSGSIGDMTFRNEVMSAGYLNEPEKTRKATTKDGFCMIGDSAFIDGQGRVYVMGRQANAIHRGAVIHYPGWIETQIWKVPGVEDVGVVGVPDPAMGEEICACVVPSDGSGLTAELIRDQSRGLFFNDCAEEMTGMPKHFLIVDTFPRNANGKTDTKLLRAEACKRLGIEC